MKQRRWSALFLALFAAFALVLASCASSDSDGSDSGGGDSGGGESAATCQGQTGEEPAASDLGSEDDPDGAGVEVGLVFDIGGKDDKSFNEAAYNGLVAAEENMGVTGTELEPNDDGSNREALLRQLADDGAGLVIGVGFNFAEVMPVVAQDYPDTSFAIIDSVVEEPNVASLVFAEEQGSFLVGAAAALKSQTGHIGFIGGQEIDLIKKFEAGYTAGAKYVNPDIIVDVQYLGPAGDDTAWGSPDEAKQIANGWYADGADVIYTAAGGSGQGTIEAAVESDAWAIGVDSDQYLTATPEQQAHILTSMLKRVDVAVFETIKAAQAGTLEGGFALYDLARDGVGYSTSGGYLDDVKAQLDDIKAKIIAGEIVVPTAPEG